MHARDSAHMRAMLSTSRFGLMAPTLRFGVSAGVAVRSDACVCAVRCVCCVVGGVCMSAPPLHGSLTVSVSCLVQTGPVSVRVNVCLTD